ncbi:MAG TPA: anthranilate synthase component I family protein [Nitrospiria bacterium]|nr:anthranilate synthase component I family protein [Nitrospiria bacterium]
MTVPTTLITLPAGALTPAEVFRRLESHPALRAVALLESAQSIGPTGRFSFIALNPFLRVQSTGSAITFSGNRTGTVQGRPLSYLRSLLSHYALPAPPQDLPPFLGGAVGYFGYDLVHGFERLPRSAIRDPALPDLDLFLTGTVVAFDHQEATLTIAHTPFGGPGTPPIDEILRALERENGPPRSRLAADSQRPVPITAGQTRGDYEALVRRCLRYIAAGDIFQANLAHRFSVDLGAVEPWTIYERLRAINPSPFAAYLNCGLHRLVSASPERLVSLHGRHVQTRPIAGTRPRGVEQQQDLALVRELLSSEKERAEHLMLIDLERNDLGRVCDYGSIKVDELMVTERYSHVTHLVSNITGRLHPGKDWADLLQAVFPGGTVTGVPKVRCMEILDELEPVGRGPYSGSIGYVSFAGDLDMNIVIRTLIVQGQTGSFHVGAGIVADSDPAREYEETLYKAQAIRDALAGA